MSTYNDNLSDDERELVRHYEEADALGRLDYFDVDEMEIIIEHYLYDGDSRNAQKALEYGFKLHPGDRYLQCQKAAILLQRGQLQEALRLIDLYRDADDPVHTFNRAEILYKLGRKNEALAIFRDLVENNDDENDTPGLCSDIIRLVNSQNDFKNSLYFFDKALAINPNDLDLLETKGMTLDDMGQKAEAAAIYNKVLDADPYRVSTWHMLGICHFESGKFREALTAYDYALAIEPSDSIALAQKAFCQFNIGDENGGIATCVKYLKNNPDDEEMLVLLGQCYANIDKTTEAQQLFQKALTINPKNSSAWFGLSLIELWHGKTNKAKQYITKAIDLSPNTPDMFVALAKIQQEEKNFEGAIDTLLHVVNNLNGDMAEAWGKLGENYMSVNDSAKALEAYERAIKLCDEQHLQVDELPLLAAVACYDNADYDKAQHYYDRAKRLNDKAKNAILSVIPEAGKHLDL